MIISGFFTEMIIRRYGVSQFIDKRLRRIGLPYIVFVPLITILFITAYMIGGFFVDWDSININEEAKEEKLEDEFNHGPSLVYVFFTNFYFSLFRNHLFFKKNKFQNKY